MHGLKNQARLRDLSAYSRNAGRYCMARELPWEATLCKNVIPICALIAKLVGSEVEEMRRAVNFMVVPLRVIQDQSVLHRLCVLHAMKL
jgi:hypothetical protein